MGSRSVDRAPVAGESFNGEEELAQALGLPDRYSLMVEQARATVSGLTRIRLRVQFDGVLVRNFSIQATSTTNKPCDNLYTGAVSGRVPTFTDLKTDRKMGRAFALQKTVEYLNANINGVEVAESGDIDSFITEKQIYVQEDGTAVLVYFAKGSFQKNGVILYPRVLIALPSNEIILQNFDLMNATSAVVEDYSSVSCPTVQGGNPRLPFLNYGMEAGQVCLNAYYKPEGNSCRYKSDKVIVFDAKGSSDRSLAQVVKFRCDEGPQDSVNGALSPASDAFYLAHKFYDMMQTLAGVTVKTPHYIYVHFGDQMANAFWDGYTTSFGNGNGGFYPFTTPDIIGHELCHAYTDKVGNSFFTEESLVAAESFSDVCGKVLSFFVHPAGQNDNWSFGDTVSKDPNWAVRFFDTPTRSFDVQGNINDVTETREAVGVYNKLFYLLVSEYNVDYRTAFQLFVQANTIYWQSEGSFYSTACGLLQAAADIGIQQDSVSNVLSQVGFTDMTFCDLTGTQDTLADGERRENVVVSQSKNPSFQVTVPEGKSGLVATVQCEHANTLRYTLKVEGDGMTYVAKDSIVFEGTGARTLTVTTNKQEDSTVSLTLTYY